MMNREFSQFKKSIYNFKEGYHPNITMVLVNKRIHQRFIEVEGENVENASPGSVVNQIVTENKIQDFYMVSAQVFKGTARPAHYYLCYNDKRDVTLEVIEKVAFAMSHMYFNCANSIKVPAQIALADKKAYYCSILRSSGHENLKCTQSFL